MKVDFIKYGLNLQVKLWYEKRSYELIITIINAIDLPLTSAGKFRNPYCKIYLLPDRRYDVLSILKKSSSSQTNMNKGLKFRLKLSLDDKKKIAVLMYVKPEKS